MEKERYRGSSRTEAPLKTLAGQAKEEVVKAMEGLDLRKGKVDKKIPQNRRASDNLSYLDNLLRTSPKLQEHLRLTDKQIVLDLFGNKIYAMI